MERKEGKRKGPGEEEKRKCGEKEGRESVGGFEEEPSRKADRRGFNVKCERERRRGLGKEKGDFGKGWKCNEWRSEEGLLDCKEKKG